MKTSIKTIAMCLGVLSIFSACNDDREAVTVLGTPSSFTLNKPVFAAANVDLKASASLDFTWSQPAYGMPVAATYEMQFSPTNNWTVSVSDALADKTQKAVPTYGNAGGVQSTCNVTVETADIATILQRCAQYKDGAVPATQTVYARCQSVFSGDTIYSNVVEMQVAPYYVELKNAAPNYWYLIGWCVGDAQWKEKELGSSIMPFYPVAGETYDAKTGDGKLTWTGYLTTAGFKLIHKVGSWAEQAGSSDGGTTISWNDGGSQNIAVPTDGYYTLTLTTKPLSLTVTPVTDAVAAPFATMFLTGEFDNWAVSQALKPFHTYAGAKNHDWVTTLELAADGKVKFTTDAGWTANWGASDFPFGTAASQGKDIPAKAGKYMVFFNDITGQYNFIPQE